MRVSASIFFCRWPPPEAVVHGARYTGGSARLSRRDNYTPLLGYLLTRRANSNPPLPPNGVSVRGGAGLAGVRQKAFLLTSGTPARAPPISVRPRSGFGPRSPGATDACGIHNGGFSGFFSFLYTMWGSGGVPPPTHPQTIIGGIRGAACLGGEGTRCCRLGHSRRHPSGPLWGPRSRGRVGEPASTSRTLPSRRLPPP